MLFDYIHNNHYKWSLAINFFCTFYLLEGLTLVSKPYSAIHSHATSAK